MAGLASDSRLASHQNWHTSETCRGAEESCQLLHYRTKVPGWLGRTRDSAQSRGQVARPPYLGKFDISYSFSPYYIQTLIPTKCRQLLKKILREKPQRKIRLIHPQSSNRDSSNSSTLFLSIVKSLRGILPRPFLTIPISMRRLFVALGSS